VLGKFSLPHPFTACLLLPVSSPHFHCHTSARPAGNNVLKALLRHSSQSCILPSSQNSSLPYFCLLPLVHKPLKGRNPIWQSLLILSLPRAVLPIGNIR
jgi:hypothetical protein